MNKDVWLCSDCGVSNAYHEKRCFYCGTPAPPPENPPHTGNRDSEEARAIEAAREFVERNDERIRAMPLNCASEAFQEGAEWGLRASRAELLAEVERLELESDGHRLEAAERKENERCLREEVARLRIAVLAAKKWDEGGDCELPPEGKPRLSEICDEALGAGHREGE